MTAPPYAVGGMTNGSADHDDRREPAAPATTEAVLRRVRKLLDKAAGTGNEHEAETFARKAAELVARHRIDPDRLAALDDDELALREFPLGRGAYVRARLALLMSVATPHDVRVVFGTAATGTVAYAAGFRSDLDVVEVMYHSLHQQAAAKMATIRRGTAASTQRFRRSFLFGFASRIGAIVADSRREAERGDGDHAAARGAVAPVSLALRRRAVIVDEFTERSFGRVRAARAATSAISSGFVEGARAAEGADVGRSRLPGRRAIGRARP